MGCFLSNVPGVEYTRKDKVANPWTLTQKQVKAQTTEWVLSLDPVRGKAVPAANHFAIKQMLGGVFYAIIQIGAGLEIHFNDFDTIPDNAKVWHWSY